ncbi:MAG TPA: hypothetical protein VN577_12315 [Terriglobales bacterium]|nr:hypothetical protein [Terriglobales bacterium]
MAHFPQTNSSVRAARVSLRRPASIDFRVDDKGIIRGNLYVLSATGGRAQTSRAVEPGSLVELRIGSDSGTIRGIAELLPGSQTVNGWVQPFRFVALADEDYESLRKIIAAS